MKDTLDNLFENIKERLKSLIAEFQESESYIKIKDKYDELTYLQQKIVKYLSYSIVVLILLWLPISAIMDSSTQNDEFNQRRQAIKEFLKLQREASSLPMLPNAPTPLTLKGQMDQKIIAMGVTQEQIKEASEDNSGAPPNVEMRGIRYALHHITIKQAINISYELEQVDRSLRLADVELMAEQKDPHFYDFKFRIINFAPKGEKVANAK